MSERNNMQSRTGSLPNAFCTTFEILNELYTAIGAGILGMVVLLKHGFDSHQSIKTLSVVALTAASLMLITRRVEKFKPSKKKVVCISGCDSGLGFSLAQHADRLGFTVIAGFLNLESKGAKEIKKIYGGKIIQIHLDVTDIGSVQAAKQTLEHFLSQNPSYSLHAVINNSGVMIFGEFEWLTERLIQNQVSVNFLGTLKFTNALCPLIRKYKARIISITSHCAQATLPGLSVYGATKAAIAAWSDGLRVELGKYGVPVITFIPGSFATQSNIMQKQLQYVQEMHDSFTQEQHNFYSDYFKRYNVYLSFITAPEKPKMIMNDTLYEVFECTLVDKYPNIVYKCESIRYKIFHLLFKYSPWCLRDYLVTYFMEMPDYVPPKDQSLGDDIDDIDL